MRGRSAAAYGRRMESTPQFGSTQLALSDARIVLGILNHVRYDALRWMFGVEREGANVVTAVFVLSAADFAYEGARRIAHVRPGMPGVEAAIGAIALRDAALGVAGPAGREIPGFATLVAGAALAGLAAPGLRRMASRAREAEHRIRSERIRRYAAARERMRAVAG
jgi:hypothetical protein